MGKKRALALLIGLVLVEALDGFTTYAGIRAGALAEGNRLMRSLVNDWTFVLLKTACGILLAVWFWKNLRRSIWVHRTLILTVVAGMLLVVWNCLVLWDGYGKTPIAQVNWENVHDPAILQMDRH